MTGEPEGILYAVLVHQCSRGLNYLLQTSDIRDNWGNESSLQERRLDNLDLFKLAE